MYAKKKFFSLFTALVMIFAMVGVVPEMEVKVSAQSQADALVSIALAEEGYTEGSNNNNKYGAYFGNNNVAWCAYFVSWCARQAGIPESIIKTNAWAGSMGSSKRTGNFGGQYYPKGSITPQKGDIVYYGWGSSTSQHVEIVISTSGSTFTSIGGNTKGNTSTEGVRRHSNYSFTSSQVVGYERPNYSGSSNPPVQNNDDELGIPYPRPSGNPLLSTGSKGSGVSWLQTALNKANNAGLAVDGDFGSGTKQAVINFQKSNGLDADGIAGPATINKLVEVIKGGMVHKPTWAWISATDDRTSFNVGEQIHFWFSADETSSQIAHYTIGINKEGERIITEDCGSDYYISFDEPGEYSVYVSAYNSAGWADSNVINFQVVTPIPKGHVMSESEAAGQTIPDGDYWIYSSINQNYALDIPYDCISSPGANIQTWIWDKEVMPTQYDVFTVTYCGNGFYEIRQKDTDLCLDVFDASLDRGTNVQLWTENDTASQQWSITRTDTGYMLQARCNGYCLDVYGGEFEKETNIRVWDQNNSLAQRFLFIPYGESYGRSIDDGVYSIRSAINSDYCIDVAGNAVNSNYKNGTNVQLWETASCDDLFYVEYLSNGYYNISEISTGLSIDVYNSVSESVYMNVNTNIQLYERHDGRSQSWLIKDNGDGTYALISKLSGYCLDLKDRACEDGQNIAQFIYNYAGAQKWKFVPVLPEKISIEAIPNKTSYEIGEKLNTIGIGVREIYSVDTFRDITDDITYSYDFSKAGKSNVTILYTIKGTTYKDNFSVNVNGSEVKGDLNADGKLSIADAVKLKSWLTSAPNSKLENQEAADLNSDGKINVFDLCILKRMLIKK